MLNKDMIDQKGFSGAKMDALQHKTFRNLNDLPCNAFRMLNTTYNGDENVPPYVGIMFEMLAFTDIEIKTFEIDVRWDLDPTDLSVQVYTIAGPYYSQFNQSSAWALLASTDLVLAPEGNSGIIPVSDFSSMRVGALEKRSFYITMKGSFIDHTVYGLQKTGDIHVTGNDIQLYVGSGFTSDNFPDAIDTVLDPQFAGVVHYEKTFQCEDDQAASTNIEFQLLFERANIDESFVLNWNVIINDTMNKLLESNKILLGFVNGNGLQKKSGSTTTAESYSGA
jgi:hypothetical protein